MSNAGEHKGNLPRLSTVYLLLAAVMATVFLVVAFTASHLTNTAVKENVRSATLSERTRAAITDIRSALRVVDNTLNSTLLVPQPEHEVTIHRQLTLIEERIQLIMDDPAIRHLGLEAQLDTLEKSIGVLVFHLNDLIQKREDPAWVYPLLTYLTDHLLAPHVAFETAADQALREIAARDGRPYASELYGAFDEVRDLWRRMVLNFRAGMIRFAGLDERGLDAQDSNVDVLLPLIEARLDRLEERKQAGELGFEAEAALHEMQQAAIEWKGHWRTIGGLHATAVWRADLEYMTDHILPAQERVFSSLGALESTLHDWSSSNTAALQDVAHRTTYQLWGLALLGLGFMAVTFVVMRRSVLEPLRQIAESLARHDDRRLPENTLARSQEVQQLVKAFNDLQQQVQVRTRALEHQALHDALTGLPNRVLLNDRLEQAISHMRRTGGSMAVLLLDLDRFKEVNDALGHPVGDRLLQEVALRLQGSLRSTDTVARLGGDEFAILARDTDELGAREFAAKIRQAISGVFVIDHQNVYVGTSIGIALYPDHGEDASTLMRRADIAMYVAKEQSDGLALYHPDSDDHTADRLALVGDLHAELRDPRHLYLHYQPMIRLPQGSPAGVEALLRWHHPTHGPVAPDHLIRMAEHTGLIGPLTYWVLENAISEFIRIDEAHRHTHLSVNLSAWNLQDPNLPQAVSSALEKTGFPPERLTLEITESAMMSDPVNARQILELLSVMGVRLAVDDFGTGFSSLGYLKLLPVNVLKIDRSFVMDMLESENDAIIVRSTIDLAHNLGFRVVAEGVENGEVLALLGALGCDFAQGYYISRPGNIDAVSQWLDRYLEDDWRDRLVVPGLRVLGST
ncbi:GGDEF-domain containing protein [Thioalkalivibrio denitrificans]|uniref:GGDEF-domain containing protein n=1 Tax=Thioalkalivibrio denitrificans TaxID=108003 RepID=A0A1V3N8S8_9GAMM|nr:EAL domain-containing protein [Thioalkalivibrio denitrificans]OOG21444.1 GGDEF-domain containing protein [Thioalkalivibrio denitrificans]